MCYFIYFFLVKQGKEKTTEQQTKKLVASWEGDSFQVHIKVII